MKRCNDCKFLYEDCGDWGLPMGVVCMKDKENPNYKVSETTLACKDYEEMK